MTTLDTLLRDLMRGTGIGAQTLSKLTGIPRTAIDNWREGTVRRPRQWRPLVEIARVLSLSRAETDELLTAAKHPVLAELYRDLPADHPDRTAISWWLAAAPPALPCFQLRAATPDFVGREPELASVLAALSRAQGGQAAPVIAIRGMGGIGKTELALLAAARMRGVFPGSQLVVHLHGVQDQPLAPAQALRQIIHTFTPEAKLGNDLEELQRRYCSVLDDRRVLILADDVLDAAQVRPLLPPPGNALLLTTRHRFTLPGLFAVDLEQLAERESVQLLRTIADRIPEQSAREIGRACGGLPLALRISGSLLANDPALPVAEHASALGDRGKAFALLRDPDDAQADLAASFGLSYARLDESAQSVFRQLGVLVGDFGDELGLAVVTAQSDVDVLARLRLLLRRNLLGYDPVRGRWRLHDLVRGFALALLAESGEHAAVTRRYARASLVLTESIQRQFRTGGAGMAEALTRFDVERSHLDTDADLQTEQLGQLHLELGEVAQAREYFEQQLAGQVQSGDRPRQLQTLNRLGQTALRLGNPALAILTHQRQLDLARELGDPRGQAMALCNLGGVHAVMCRREEALAALEPALAVVRGLHDRYGEGAVLHNIGLAHLFCADRIPANVYFEQSLVLSRSLGDKHGEAVILADLARSLMPTETAVSHAFQAVQLAQQTGSRPAEATARFALAQCQEALGVHAAAEKSFQDAYELYQAIGDRLGSAQCGWHLGKALRATDPQRASSLMRQSQAFWHEIGHSSGADSGVVRQ